MSDDTHRRLHDQLFALGTLEPPPGLADGALREAKQRRRRGIAAVAAAAAVMLAIAIAVPLSMRHTSAGPTTPPPGPVQRNVVVNYQVLTRKNPDGILMVLDPKTGKYVESKLPVGTRSRPAPFAASDLVASPDGQQYASPDGKHVGTLSDVINGNVAGFHKLDPGQMTGQSATWSADSSRLLIPIQGINKNFSLTGFRIYDTQTKHLDKLVHLSTDDVQDLTWAADGTGLMGLVGQKLEFFDLDGKLQRTVTLPKHVDSSRTVSPDGRYMSLDKGLFDLQTGRTYPLQLPGRQQIVVPIPLGWLDDDHYAVDWKYSSGKKVEQRLLVLSKSGKLIKSIKPPLGTADLPKTEGKAIGVTFDLGYGADYPNHSGLRL